MEAMKLYIFLLVTFLLESSNGRISHLPLNEKRTGGDMLDDDVLGEPISEEEFSASENLEDEHIDPNNSPIELSGLYEGDIDFDDTLRNAIRDNQKKWPNAVIPYVISSEFSSADRLVIAKAIKRYHDTTCIRILPRTSESAYVHIKKGNGCTSPVGRTGSAQTLSLGAGCVHMGVILHEFMHAAGFWHEQSRNDRDNYVKINLENIKDGLAFAFDKYSLTKIRHLNSPYDTCSIMHYGAYAFSKNGNPTITQLDEGSCAIGQMDDFSEIDIKKLNTLYQCEHYPQITSTSECKDENQSCAAWAERGECDKNPAYMLHNCKLSCGVCKVKCVNKNEYCEAWANSGECQRNPHYMLPNCRLSCGTCQITECVDDDDSCSQKADAGQCEKNPSYMMEKCQKSCGICKVIECVDKNKNCEYWAGVGECEKNPRYMLTNCEKSCQTCQGGECADENENCEYWAGIGECDKNPGYMLQKCRKSCDICRDWSV